MTTTFYLKRTTPKHLFFSMVGPFHPMSVLLAKSS
jgi:hypothetical protein